jgi:hypothetical protein
VGLPLRERGTEPSDFGLQAGDMADCANSDTAQIISATASLSKFASILVGGPAFASFLGSLDARRESVLNRRADCHRHEAEFHPCAPGGVAAVKNGRAHTLHLRN